MENFWIMLLRLGLSAVLGLLIGVERTIRSKEAGLRTHAIVSIGACLIMMVSKYGFSDIAEYDASRVAAQIVSGIGFIGAGIILQKKHAIMGLSTAAGVWTTAGVGMAAGAGLYEIACAAAALIILLQVLLHLPIRLFQGKSHYFVKIVFDYTAENGERVKQSFRVGALHRTRMDAKEDGTVCTGYVYLKEALSDERMWEVLQENPFVHSIEILQDE